MARPPMDLEITINAAHDLKNVNWKHGDLCAIAVAWVEEQNKISTRVDASGDTNPSWGQKFTIPVEKNLDEARLTIEVFHDKAEKPEKAIVGSLSLPLMEIIDAGGSEETLDYNLKLKRPSGRPHGKIDFSVRLRSRRYAAPPPPGVAPPYGGVDAYPPPHQTREGGYPYAYPTPGAYPYSGYPSGYPPQPSPYADPYGQTYSYSAYGSAGAPPPAYGAQPAYAPYQAPQQPAQTGSKFGGMGTGLAVGALAGAVGGLALGEYIDHEEDEAAERQAEEDAERYYGGGGGGDDDYGGDDY